MPAYDTPMHTLAGQPHYISECVGEEWIDVLIPSKLVLGSTYEYWGCVVDEFQDCSNMVEASGKVVGLIGTGVHGYGGVVNQWDILVVDLLWLMQPLACYCLCDIAGSASPVQRTMN